MTIEKNLNGENLDVTIEGRLDTSTAPQLEAEFGDNLAGIKSLALNFEKLEYISSAGLRVLLAAQKRMNAEGGTMVIKGVNEAIDEIFEITGFSEILTIER